MKQCKSDYRKQWRKNNPEKVKLQTKRSYLNRKKDGRLKQSVDKYRAKNRSKINMYNLEWYHKNKTKISKRRKENYALKSNSTRKLRELKRAEVKLWRSRQTPERLYAIDRRAQLKRNYGITVEQYEQMFKHQRGCCAICKKKPKKGRMLCVDHNHSTGVVRGLLCDLCNTFLGRINESQKCIKNILKYLDLKENTTMPVKRVVSEGKPAFRWGEHGKAYTYTAGNAASRERAKKKAIQQGLAVAKRTGTQPEL